MNYLLLDQVPPEQLATMRSWEILYCHALLVFEEGNLLGAPDLPPDLQALYGKAKADFKGHDKDPEFITWAVEHSQVIFSKIRQLLNPGRENPQ